MDIGHSQSALAARRVLGEGIHLSKDGSETTGGRTLNTKPARARDPIGDALKKLHDSVANEPIPPSFLDLVAEIEKKIEQSR